MTKKKYTSEEEREIAEEWIYTSTPSIDIALKYGYKTPKSITDKVKKYFPEIDVRKHSRERIKAYSLDFSTIDTQFKAYLLGLMYTDGYVASHNKYGIDLVDEDCIAYLAKETNHKYSTYGDQGAVVSENGKEYQRKDKHRIIFYSEDNVNQLAELGVTRRKSATLSPIDISNFDIEIRRHIIRGVIDGDGSIYQHSNGNSIGFYILSQSEKFIQWSKMMLESIGFTDMRVRQRSDGLFITESASHHNITLLHNLVYKEEYGMKRKRNHLREMFRDYNRGSDR